MSISNVNNGKGFSAKRRRKSKEEYVQEISDEEDEGSVSCAQQ